MESAPLFTGLDKFGPAQNEWAGSGPVKQIFSKVCDFYAYNFIEFCLNIGLYFYTVKIQIQYQNTRFSSKH
jgi:hypothetical protein